MAPQAGAAAFASLCFKRYGGSDFTAGSIISPGGSNNVSALRGPSFAYTKFLPGRARCRCLEPLSFARAATTPSYLYACSIAQNIIFQEGHICAARH